MPTSLPPPTSELLEGVHSMTAYFDDLNREIAQLSDQFSTSNAFFDHLVVLEERVIKDVSLMTGDREFPDHLREGLMSLIAIHRLRDFQGNIQLRSAHYAGSVRTSRLISELHSAMHTVACLRINTRFGIITDDPAANVKARDMYDAERHIV